MGFFLVLDRIRKESVFFVSESNLRRNSLRRLLARVCIYFASLCTALLLLEIGLRLASPQDLGFWDCDPIRRILSTPPHFVENIPHDRTKFIGVPININSYGLRGNEISIPKPPRTVRVLAVGDSITFGYGIPFEDTYPQVLETRLNQTAPAGTRYEVLNGGTVGGSLGDYLHFLSQKAKVLEPDVVLIGLTLNDIFVYAENGSVLETGAEWHGGRLPLVRRASGFLLRHSHLYMFCYARLKSFLYGSGALDINKVQGSNFAAIAPPSAYQLQAWASSLGMLSQIVAFCRENSYRIVLVVFPMQMQMSSAELQFYRDRYHLRLSEEALSGGPQRRLREFGAAAGVPVVDLLPIYRAHPEDLYLRNKMIPSDPTHPSVRGDRLAAEEVFRVLKRADGSSR